MKLLENLSAIEVSFVYGGVSCNKCQGKGNSTQCMCSRAVKESCYDVYGAALPIAITVFAAFATGVLAYFHYRATKPYKLQLHENEDGSVVITE